MTDDSIQEYSSSVICPSDIEQDDEDRLEQDSDDISDKGTQHSDGTAPSDDIINVDAGNRHEHADAMSDINGEEPFAKAPEEYSRNESESGNTHTGDTASDHTASMQEIQDHGGGEGIASAEFDVPMGLEAAVTNAEAEANQEVFDNGITETLTSIETEACSGNGGGSVAVEKHPCNSDDSSREVLRDLEWVILAATIMKQNGKEGDWEEIIDIWVRLQRTWERIKVRTVLEST